jgi:hypothetical protein
MPEHVDVERPADVEPLLVTVWAAAALGVVTALTLLVTGHFDERWFVLVFLTPALAFLALGAVRLRTHADDRPRSGGD